MNPVTGPTALQAVLRIVKSALNGKQDKLPTGMISIWYGAVNAIPDGWALCDGTNGTPDLRDRFVVGAGNSYSVGDAGGEAAHALTTDEMPAHSHFASVLRGKLFTLGTSAGNYLVTSSQTDNSKLSGTSAGSGQAHNNMPPYYALAYIMKL